MVDPMEKYLIKIDICKAIKYGMRKFKQIDK